MEEQMIRKSNMKLFPIYKMFSWDLLFHYAIIFLFLTQVKGFSASQVLLVDAFYAIFRVVFQILCINIVDLFGKQKTLLLGNIFLTISMLMLTTVNSFSLLILSKLIEAIGFNLKGICEPTILSDSIPKSTFFSSIYSKIDRKGSSFYFIFDAVSSVVTGFLYVVNPYIPMIMCFTCCLISTFISFSFEEPLVKGNTKTGITSFKFSTYLKDMIITFKQIAKSNRLKSLLIFSLCFWAVLSVFNTLRSSILVDINVPEQYFGIILAFSQVISSLSAKKEQWFHKKLRNKTLSYFSLSIITSFIFTGLLVACNINFIVSLLSILITILLVGFIKGPYFSLMLRYFNSFSNSSANIKIFAVKLILENLGRIIISLLASFLLQITTTSYVFIIMGCMFLLIFIFLLKYMKTKVGLNPKEYSKEDLIFFIPSE